MIVFLPSLDASRISHLRQRKLLYKDLMPSNFHQANRAKLFLRDGNFFSLTQAKKIDLFWKVPLKIHQPIVSGVGV